MPIQRRLPKRGFTPIRRDIYTLLNIRDLVSFQKESTVDVAGLVRLGIIRHLKGGVKLLGQGEIQVPLTVKVHKCSQGARLKIDAAGGTVEVI